LEKGFQITAGTWVAYAGISHYSQTQKASEDAGSTGFERGSQAATFAATGSQVGGQFAANPISLNQDWTFSWSAGTEYAHRHDHDALTLNSYYLVDPSSVGELNGTQVGQNTWRAFADARITRNAVTAFLRADAAKGNDVRGWGAEAGVKLSW